VLAPAEPEIKVPAAPAAIPEPNLPQFGDFVRVPNAPYFVVTVAPGDTLPAFPGCEGFGCESLNTARANVKAATWPYKPWPVTNLNDTGAGSFRVAIDSVIANPNAYNVIYFRTGGELPIVGSIEKANIKNVYIAGQTAPGEGITFRQGRIRFTSGAQDVVARYLRHRSKFSQAWIVNGGGPGVFNHWSTSWSSGHGASDLTQVSFSGDTTGGATKLVSNWTYSESMAYEPHVDHPTIALFSGLPRANPAIDSISVYRNFMAGPGHRTPICSGHSFEVVRNVVYNWTDRATECGDEATADFVSNYYRAGPSTSGDHRALPLLVTSSADDATELKSIFAENNRSAQNSFGLTLSRDSTHRGSQRQSWCRRLGSALNCDVMGDTIDAAFALRGTPFSPRGLYPTDRGALTDGLRDNIVANAGMSKLLTCAGNLVNARDAADSLRVTWFETSGGLSTWVDADTIPFPSVAVGTACTDTDNDMMPDAFEIDQGFTATSLPPDTVLASGYFAFELYLAGEDLDFGGVSNACGAGHWIYWATLQQDTISFFIGGVLSSRLVNRPSVDSISPNAERSNYLFNADSTLVMFTTAVQQAMVETDSTVADSIALATPLSITDPICPNLVP